MAFRRILTRSDHQACLATSLALGAPVMTIRIQGFSLGGQQADRATLRDPGNFKLSLLERHTSQRSTTVLNFLLEFGGKQIVAFEPTSFDAADKGEKSMAANPLYAER